MAVPNGKDITELGLSPRSRSTENVAEHADEWEPPPPPPSNQWLSPSVIISTAALLFSIGSPLFAIYPKLSALETLVNQKGELLSETRAEVAQARGFQREIARIFGQLDTINVRLEAQRELLLMLQSQVLNAGVKSNEAQPRKMP